MQICICPCCFIADCPNKAKKLSFESYSQAYLDKGYNASTILNLKTFYDQIEANQIFGSAYLKKILECLERTARSLLSKLKEMNVVAVVNGHETDLVAQSVDEVGNPPVAPVGVVPADPYDGIHGLLVQYGPSASSGICPMGVLVRHKLPVPVHERPW